MSNHLVNEKSPYLRQHALDPVDWYPWGAEAFEKARREDKPVFLSIGYSTCHYCHLMARESFQSADVAAILNKSYVPVKVDREERSDIDAVYMLFCTAVNGSGGWPLTVLTTPEGKPFFVGTYIPKGPSGGQAGLLLLLEAMAKKWRSERETLLRAAEEITGYVNSSALHTGTDVDVSLPQRAASQLAASYDSEYGGFGTAVKFPSPHDLIFLMEYSALRGDRYSREMAEHTLRQMYRGGIYDHIGGGFARYSTDREWLAPHFEKTLYDNALLALAYTEAWQDGHMALYRTVAESCLDYCLRELKCDDGGFFSAQDADSGGKEGAYYLFTPGEIRAVLGEDDGRHFCECYDITDEGNFHGKSIPNLLLNNRWSFLPEGYDDFRERLRIYRAERMELHTDRKILTAWNGMLLMALSRAAFAFGDRRYLAEAKALARFMDDRLCAGTLPMARLCEGELRYDGRLDDHAFFALGLLELYGADRDAAHIVRAKALAERILLHFRREGGGFYHTADESERLVLRPIEIFDGAVPSGNSAAAMLFTRLWALTGEERWLKESVELLAFIGANSGKYSGGCAYALSAQLMLDEVQTIVCVCRDETVPPMLSAVTARYAPALSVLVKTPGNAEALALAAPFTSALGTADGKTAIYIFRDHRLSGQTAAE